MADPVHAADAATESTALEVVARALCPARHHLALDDADAVLSALSAVERAISPAEPEGASS